MRELDPATSEAHATILRLQSAYADVISRRAWDELGDLFTDEAVVRIDVRNPERPPFDLVGPAAMGEFLSGALDAFAFFEFSILTTVVDVAPGAAQATGRVYLCELRCDHAGAWSQAFGLYQDRYARSEDGDWRIAGRHYASLARLAAAPGTHVDTFPFPDLA